MNLASSLASFSQRFSSGSPHLRRELILFLADRRPLTILCLTALLGSAPPALGQFGPQQVINASATNASSVYATDLDGDGDADVLSAGTGDGTIAWYENLGGGSFGTQRVITTSAAGASSVYAIDLNGDGDADVLSASRSFNGGKVAWYENLGGGLFGTEQVITTSAVGFISVYAIDLDGDGDADVLSAGGVIAWYENLGGGSFSTQKVITTSVIYPWSVYATDLDGDGDADVLSASYDDDKIAWYENLGGGSFGNQQVIAINANGASSVFATDLDGDGDADVLYACGLTTKIRWHENLGGGSFGPPRVLTAFADHPRSVYATDLDGDGDADVLSASSGDHKIAWYENLGGGMFGLQQVITTSGGSHSVYATDLDGDGDADVLSASWSYHMIAWYENLMGGPIGVSYCSPAASNSTGGPGKIRANGLDTAGGNSVTLSAHQLPHNRFGYFLNSLAQGSTHNPGGSQGTLCLSSAIGRYNPAAGYPLHHSGTNGSISVLLDLTNTPTPAGLTSITAGQTWNFQCWYRDNNPSPTSNFTDAVSITFL